MASNDPKPILTAATWRSIAIACIVLTHLVAPPLAVLIISRVFQSNELTRVLGQLDFTARVAQISLLFLMFVFWSAPFWVRAAVYYLGSGCIFLSSTFVNW